jgi:hypothetical protein
LSTCRIPRCDPSSPALVKALRRPMLTQPQCPPTSKPVCIDCVLYTVTYYSVEGSRGMSLTAQISEVAAVLKDAIDRLQALPASATLEPSVSTKINGALHDLLVGGLYSVCHIKILHGSIHLYWLIHLLVMLPLNLRGHRTLCRILHHHCGLVAGTVRL